MKIALTKEDAGYLRLIAAGMSYNNKRGEATRKHRLYEIAMRIEAILSDVEELKTNLGDAAIDGFLFGRDRKKPVVHELHAGLDDGPSWCPEEWYERPICRMVYAVDRGDPSVGIPSRASFVLAEDQKGTLLGDNLTLIQFGRIE